MDIQSLFNEIQGLQALVLQIAKREPEAIKKLAGVYYQVFKETFTVGCKSCPTKAYGKLQELTIEKLIAMKTQKFRLKKSALINYPAFSGQHYSHHNITDEKAAEILSAHPGLITSFDEYPTNEAGEVDLSLAVSQPEAIDPGARLTPEENEDLFDSLGMTDDSTGPEYLSALEAYLPTVIDELQAVKLANKIADMKAEFASQQGEGAGDQTEQSEETATGEQTEEVINDETKNEAGEVENKVKKTAKAKK